MDSNHNNHKQKITYARASLWAPFYTVGMTARIQGDVPTALVEDALRKLQVMYPPLASRVLMEKDGTAWLTTEDVGDFSLEVRTRVSEDDWAQVFLEQERIPFAFGRGPVARFFLLRGNQSSDLIGVAPHVVCDGYSMTQVMEDAVALLNDPGREVTRPLPPPPVNWQNVKHKAYDDLFLRGLVKVLNRTWPDSRVVLEQDRYEELYYNYWSREKNGALVFRLSREETASLAARCKQHGVTITGALLAAFLLARVEVQPKRQTQQPEISVAVNIRDRMIQPPDRAVGVYASSIDLNIRTRAGMPFWNLACEGHSRIHRLLGNRSLIFMPLVLDELDPSIADSLVVAVATDRWGKEFGVLTRFVKIKGDARCLNISNIGRINLPDGDAPYRLETLLPFPPLPPGGGMALNVLTVNGQMNLILKYRINDLDDAAAVQVRDRALSYLANA